MRMILLFVKFFTILQVDFQLCFYCSPAIDLQYFFNTSLNDDMLLKNEELLLNEYLKELKRILEKARCKVEPPTMADLKRMMKERAMYGMIAAFSVLPLMLVDKSEVKDVGEMLSQEEFEHPAYKSAAYRKAMARRIPKFDQLGLLD